MLLDGETDGTLLAAAADHKAEFRPDGFCFVARPHDESLGSEPITFTTTRVTVGGEPLPITSVPPQLDGQLIEWQRGGYRERVQFDQRDAEQSFVYAVLPQRGELVVTIAVATKRQGSDRGDGVVFVGRGGDVKYAEADRPRAVPGPRRRSDDGRRPADGHLRPGLRRRDLLADVRRQRRRRRHAFADAMQRAGDAARHRDRPAGRVRRNSRLRQLAAAARPGCARLRHHVGAAADPLPVPAGRRVGVVQVAADRAGRLRFPRAVGV